MAFSRAYKRYGGAARAVAIAISASFFGVFLGFLPSLALAQEIATSTVRVTVCGDAIVDGIEVCDDGPNTGQYATSTATRNCKSDCSGYGPYCGDQILQALQSEACDDGNNASGDRCSASCVVEDLPVTTGGGGGSGGAGPFSGGSFNPPPETKVVIYGKAYPEANVNVLKDGSVIGVVRANADADFYFSSPNVTPGVTTFGFWAEDSKGLRSIALTTTITVTANAITTISGAFLPPTIAVDKRSVPHGETITISGQSAPLATVIAHVNSEEAIQREVKTAASGEWKLPFDTSPLASEEFHTARAQFKVQSEGNVLSSAMSQSLSFYVGSKDVGRSFLADVNTDKRVNLVDFSILLFYWGTGTPIADLNQDKKVNLTDVSILLFYWTG